MLDDDVRRAGGDAQRVDRGDQDCDGGQLDRRAQEHGEREARQCGRDELGERGRGAGETDGDQEPGPGGARCGRHGQRPGRRGGERQERRHDERGERERDQRQAAICPHVRGSGRCGARRFAAARQATAAAGAAARLIRRAGGRRAATRRSRRPGRRPPRRATRPPPRARCPEVERAVVVGGDARRKRALRDEPAVDRPPARLAVEVRAHAPREQAEAVGEPVDAAVRVGDPAFEPAQRPGRHPGHHHAGLPGLPQDRVDPMRAPDRQQVDGVPAADVGDVLSQQVSPHVVPVPRRAAGATRVPLGRERGVEPDDV